MIRLSSTKITERYLSKLKSFFGKASLHVKITIKTEIINDKSKDTPAITTLVSVLLLLAKVKFEMFIVNPANNKSLISKGLTAKPKLTRYLNESGKKLKMNVNINHIHFLSLRSILSNMFIAEQAIYIPYSKLTNFKLQPRSALRIGRQSTDTPSILDGLIVGLYKSMLRGEKIQNSRPRDVSSRVTGLIICTFQSWR